MATFTEDCQALSGVMATKDAQSSIIDTFKNGVSFTGTINPAHTAKKVSLFMDASSKWTVTKTSHITTMSDAALSETVAYNRPPKFLRRFKRNVYRSIISLNE